MGISSITQLHKWLVKNYPQTPALIQTIPLSQCAGQVWAIDASNYMYRFKYQSQRPGAHLDGFLRLIVLLHQYQIKPIVVFDGQPPQQKRATIEERKQRRLQQAQAIQSLESRDHLSTAEKKKLRQMKRSMVTFQEDDFQQVRQLLSLLSIPFCRARGEADAVCARLAQQNKIQAVLSSDYDMLMYQCPRMIKQINHQDNTVDILDLAQVLTILQLSSYQQFVDLCLMLGTDYTTDTIPQVGPVRAWQLLSQQGLTLEQICDLKKVSPAVRQQFHVARQLVLSAYQQEDDLDCQWGCPDIAQTRTFMTQHVNYRPGTLDNYLRFLIPKIKIKVNPKVNVKVNPKVNVKVNPKVNVKVNPKVNVKVKD